MYSFYFNHIFFPLILYLNEYKLNKVVVVVVVIVVVVVVVVVQLPFCMAMRATLK